MSEAATQAFAAATQAPAAAPSMPAMTSLRLTVNNHPGVMSHICGLFARRAFNLEGILVSPSPAGSPCTLWLLVGEDQRLPQLLCQLRKLCDVLEARTVDCGAGVFEGLAAAMPG